MTLLDAVQVVWSIFDYFHTSAMEKRIYTLENALFIHQCVIAALVASLVLLIFWRKH